MKEAWRAGRQGGIPLSLAQNQGELCSSFAIIPHALISLGNPPEFWLQSGARCKISGY